MYSKEELQLLQQVFQLVVYALGRTNKSKCLL